MTKCKCYSSYTPLSYLWAFLSLLAALLCSIGLYFSNWLQRETPEGTYNSVSPFRLCLNESSQLSMSCDAYLSFNEMYSSHWKAVTLLMGFGACLSVLSALLALFGLCVQKLFNFFVTGVAVSSQGLAVLSFLVAVVVFPSGMDSENVRSDNLCGQSADSFTLGDCNVGWAYIVVIIGTVIEVVAFMLSWSPSKSRRRDTEYTFDI